MGEAGHHSETTGRRFKISLPISPSPLSSSSLRASHPRTRERSGELLVVAVSRPAGSAVARSRGIQSPGMVIMNRTPGAAAAGASCSALRRSSPRVRREAAGASCSPLPRSSPRVRRKAASPPSDPILPYLRSISKAMDDLGTGPEYDAAALDRLKLYVTECIEKYGDDYQYSTDPRLLKIYILYADATGDFPKVYKQLEERRMFLEHALLYEAYALFLFAKGQVLEADKVCGIGISRKAEPLDHLKKKHLAILKHLEKVVEEADADAHPKPSKIQKEPSVVDPWSESTRNNLLATINGDLKKFSGYHKSNKVYPGKVPLTSSQNALRNKVIELGGRKYQIKGSPGTGAFAKVYKATVDGSTEELVALKIQKPPFPWEFYIYRQLDMRISDVERPSFGYAHEVHVFADVSVLVCDYLPHGTLLDVINYHLVVNRNMDEVLCVYYTIELLHILETLHSVGIIHGDFKPDNVLVYYRSGDITEEAFISETRAEQNQGLCLVDWGRGIDLKLFPAGTEFHGDCGTSGFSCVEMQEGRTWTYQVDTYGLCAIVHMMLHGAPMSIEKVATGDGVSEYLPKQPFKRYWNVELWQSLFSTLLNAPSCGSDVTALRSLRASFREYICSNKRLVGKLNQQLAKQKASLCSS
uniref:Protein kinase domain-containing protein n=1 Tax=Arundo donax TaxID=35708 RepID=A0A0A9B922_ARUDO